MKESKRKNWNSRISQLNKEGGTKEFWNFITSMKNCRQPTINRPNWTDQQQREYLQILKSYTPDLSNGPAITNDLSDFEHKPFTMTEFKAVLFKKKNTAAGNDKIKYNMIKILPEKQLKILLEAISKQWRTGYVKKE